MPDDLVRRLDEEPVTLSIEYIARRLGLHAGGGWRIEIEGEGAFLHKTWLHRGGLGPDALEELAAA